MFADVFFILLTTNVPHHIETSQLICIADRWIVSIWWGILVVNGLKGLQKVSIDLKWWYFLWHSPMLCVEGVCIRSFYGQHFCAFGLKTDIYGVNTDQKNSDTFHVVLYSEILASVFRWSFIALLILTEISRQKVSFIWQIFKCVVE